jgi:hypothetical protein
MDIGKSFSFQFEDKQWLSKLGLGAVIALVPILNFAWSGYMVDIIRNVMNNLAEPLPDWYDISKKFNEGLILFAASIVYALPLLIVICLPLSIMAISGLLSGNRDLQDIAQNIAGAGGVLLFCLLCLFLLYGFVLSLIYPAILVLFSREGTFASCFKFRQILEIMNKAAGPFFTAWGLSVIAGFGVGFVVGFVNLFVGWIPCLGWLVAVVLGLASGVYVMTIYAHLFGQFGAIAVGGYQVVKAPDAQQKPKAGI